MLEWLAAVTVVLDPYVGVISAFATVLTAVIAIFALGSTARDSRDRSRPLVFAMFREAPLSDHNFELVVRNYGTSAARNLMVEFNPPITEKDREDELTDFVAKRYEKEIPLLPPESELTNTWWAGGMAPGSGTELVNRTNLPEEVVVKVSYKGNRFRRYRDEFSLHADTIKLKTYSVSSTSMPGRMKTISESLKTVATELKATNRQLRDIGRKLPSDESDEDLETPPSPKTRRGIREMLAKLRPGS